MRSFRQKVLLSYVVILGIFFALMFPFITKSVHEIVIQSMSTRADDIIQKLQTAQSKNDLISILKNEKHLLFYRIGIFDKTANLLYDSHTKNLNTRLMSETSKEEKEIHDALHEGIGYTESYSPSFDQKLIYLAKRFVFQKDVYVLRLAFPYQYIQELKEKFTLGFFLFGGLVLLLFAILSVLIFNHLSAPIREITKAIAQYREGNLETLPQINLKTHPKDEFTLLAKTLTSLSHQIQYEIQTITSDRNEREAILESIQAGVLVLDSNKLLLYMNSTGKNMLKLSSSAIGAPLPPLFSCDIPSLIEKAQTTGSLLVQDIELKQERNSLYFNVIAIPKAQGEGTILVLHDRSQEYRMLEMRKAFIANASHELKTPITIIRGFAETLFDHPELPQKTIKEVTQKIVDSCHKMTALIRNLLLLSDIEHLPSYRLVEVNLLELMETACSSIKEAWPTLSIKIEREKDTIDLWAAQELLEMAFYNILDNAAKYSEHSPECTILLRKENDKVIIQMRDKGIGISEEDLSHLFQRFFRGAKAGMKKYSGYGLGLSLVDTIVRKHKGSIQVESTLGLGTTFTITLPLNLKELLEAP
jgi:signal transduction histidine kinase